MCYISEKLILLNEPILCLLKVYVKNNSNRFTTEKTAEDDSLMDVMLILELLRHMMTKDLFLEERKFTFFMIMFVVYDEFTEYLLSFDTYIIDH